MTSLYRYKLIEDGDNSRVDLERITGPDVMNLTRRPRSYLADDESTWNPRCQSKLVLTRPETLLDPDGVNCSTCLKPGQPDNSVACASAEADALNALRFTQGILLRWIDVPSFVVGPVSGDVIAFLKPSTYSGSYPFHWREIPGTSGGPVTWPDWRAYGAAGYDASIEGCNHCGLIDVYPKSGVVPGFPSSYTYYITNGNGYGKCGNKARNPFLEPTFTLILGSLTSSTDLYISGEWVDLP